MGGGRGHHMLEAYFQKVTRSFDGLKWPGYEHNLHGANQPDLVLKMSVAKIKAKAAVFSL